MAAYVTARGRYELWQQPDAATPQLLLRTGSRTRLVIDFAAHLVPDQELLLGSVALTEDGRLLAYTVDVDGSDRCELRVVELDAPSDPHPVRTGSAARPSGGATASWSSPSRTKTLVPTLVARMSPTGNGYRVLCRAEAGDYVDLNQASDGRTVVISRESHARQPPAAAAAGGRGAGRPVEFTTGRPGPVRHRDRTRLVAAHFTR